MFLRFVLVLLFLLNLVLYVWLAVDLGGSDGLEIAKKMLDQPAKNLQDAEIRAEILSGIADRAMESEAKLRWVHHLFLINAIAFLIWIFMVSQIATLNRNKKSQVGQHKNSTD